MKIRLGELRLIIREELDAVGAEEVRGGWPAAIPDYEALMSLPKKTFDAIKQRKDPKTREDLHPWPDDVYPVAVTYPRSKGEGGPLTVEWTSWDQFRDVWNIALNVGNAALNRKIAEKERLRQAGGGSAKYAYLYATGMRTK